MKNELKMAMLALTLLLICLFSNCLFAYSFENAKWMKTGGPRGGLGYDVRIHPENKDILFVTDNPSGVNKSTDGGLTWKQCNEGITSRGGPSGDGIPVFCLTIDPNSPNIVWAGTQSAQSLYKSTDCGQTWVKKDKGLSAWIYDVSYRNVSIHPQNSEIVFAGAELSLGLRGKEFDKTKGAIYKTINGGESWREVWCGGSLVRFILFDKTSPNIMYASTGIFDREAYNGKGLGILKSVDGGETWAQSNNGLRNLFVGFLEMHPSDSNILFAAAGNYALALPPERIVGGIFKTTDGGKSWREVLTGYPFTIVVVSPSNPQVVYAANELSFYRSHDGGECWEELASPERGGWGPPGLSAGIPISAVVAPDCPDTIFVNSYNGGICKSEDGGKTWMDASSGYTGCELHDVAFDDSSTTIYTIGRNGPFRSDDSGKSWHGLLYGPARFLSEWNTIAKKPGNNDVLLMSDELQGKILLSEDGGGSWKIVFSHGAIVVGYPTNRHGFKDICFSPSNPNVVYAGMSRDRRTLTGDFPAGASFGMYKSVDGGHRWHEINNGLQSSLLNVNCIAVHPQNSDVVYIGTWKDGIFKTTDGGKSWSLSNNGVTAGDVRALAIDSSNPNIVYAGLGEGAGILKSTDGGKLWEETNKGVNIECPAFLLPIGRAVAGMFFDDIPKRRFGPDYYFAPWTVINDIKIDPKRPNVVYAADLNSGVYRSTDGGKKWLKLSDGLTTRAVSALAISQDGSRLCASTRGEGLFILE